MGFESLEVGVAYDALPSLYHPFALVLLEHCLPP